MMKVKEIIITEVVAHAMGEELTLDMVSIEAH